MPVKPKVNPTILIRCLFLLSGLIALFACTSLRWEAHYQKHIDLEWPARPNPVKVKYIGEIREFRQIGLNLASLLIGKSDPGKIQQPVAIAVGRDGRMAIADPKLLGVHFYVPATQKYKLIYKIKSGELQMPVAVCFDRELNLYVSDSLHRKVFVFDQDGVVVDVLAKAGKNPFGRPTGLCIDNNKELLYVVDAKLHRVHVFNKSRQFLSSFSGKDGKSGRLNLPTHITIDKEGRLFINDTMNFRMQIYNPDDGSVSMFGSHGDGSGDFALPKGVGVDRWGVIYVVDSLFDNIQLFDANGIFLLTVGGRGPVPGSFWLPSGLFIDHEDKLYVCDTYNTRIQVFQLLNNQLDGGVK